MIGSLHQTPPPRGTVSPGRGILRAVAVQHDYFVFMSLTVMSLGIVEGIVVADLSLCAPQRSDPRLPDFR
jgi:hypothetical protein